MLPGWVLEKKLSVCAKGFGHAFGVSPLIVSRIATETSSWHFLGFWVSPGGAAIRVAQLGRL